VPFLFCFDDDGRPTRCCVLSRVSHFVIFLVYVVKVARSHDFARLRFGAQVEVIVPTGIDLQYFRSVGRHFTPSWSPAMAYGLIGNEAKTLLKKLSSLLFEKWEKPYSVVCGYVNAQMSIAIV
jgi:hypothetical protein